MRKWELWGFGQVIGYLVITSGCAYLCGVSSPFIVLERVKYKYDEHGNHQLVSEHGTPLKSDHVRGSKNLLNLAK